MTDYFFSLAPIELRRLQRIFDLSRQFVVELETHPYEPAEYSFLTKGRIRELLGHCRVARRYDMGWNENQ
jgi:hypothetical protein